MGEMVEQMCILFEFALDGSIFALGLPQVAPILLRGF